MSSLDHIYGDLILSITRNHHLPHYVLLIYFLHWGNSDTLERVSRFPGRECVARILYPTHFESLGVKVLSSFNKIKHSFSKVLASERKSPGERWGKAADQNP